eukprot:26654_1
MEDILCDNEHEFQMILGIIEAGITDDEARPLKRDKEGSESPCLKSLRQLCIREYAERINTAALHGKRPIEFRVCIESLFTTRLTPFVPYLKAYGYEKMNHVLCDNENEFEEIVKIIEKGIEAQNKEIEQYDKHNSKSPKQPIKPIRIKQAVGGPVFKRLQKLCMRDLAEGKWGWITRADDSDTEVDIGTYFKGNLAPFAKYLKDECYETMEDILCDDEDAFDQILEIIECGIAEYNGRSLKRANPQREYGCLRSLRELCIREFSVIVEIIEKGIEAENKQIEPPKQPIKPIRIKSKRGCPRFVKLQRLCMRDLAEGKWGWITRADDLDTEVDIERYFKGQLAPFAKYLKDECYET